MTQGEGIKMGEKQEMWSWNLITWSVEIQIWNSSMLKRGCKNTGHLQGRGKYKPGESLFLWIGQYEKCQ